VVAQLRIASIGVSALATYASAQKSDLQAILSTLAGFSLRLAIVFYGFLEVSRMNGQSVLTQSHARQRFARDAAVSPISQQNEAD